MTAPSSIDPTRFLHEQLARAADLRRPWERPVVPGRLTPARVRRSFRHIRPTTLLPARAPKPRTCLLKLGAR